MATRDIQALERFGDFEIVGELGRGGMGVVYEAQQLSLKRKVALKVLSGRMGLTPRAITRFKLEAESAASLHHTNIVPIFATGEQDGIPFYAMEFVDGPSLDRVIRQMRLTREGPALANDTTRGQGRTPSTKDADPDSHALEAETRDPAIDWSVETIVGPSDDASEPLDNVSDSNGAGATVIAPPDKTADAETVTFVKVSGSGIRNTHSTVAAATSSVTSTQNEKSFSLGAQFFTNAARLLADVADALQHAHDKGIIHRDIKPANMLMSRDGRLCLNDFGLVRVMDAPGVTVSGEFVGSPLYMSPEQIVTGRKPIDHRTDIYSLGATLYELVTLQPPFVGTRRDEILTQILSKEPTEPRRINRKVPPDLETICLKALEKIPERRYATAAEMADDLRRFVDCETIFARRTGPVGRLLKWTRRRPGVATLSACVVMLVLAAGILGYQSWQADRAATALEKERLNADQTRLQQEQARQRAVQADDAMNDAVREAMNGQYDRIERHVVRAEEFGIEPGPPELLRGLAAAEAGSYQEAIDYLQLAIERLPDSVAARVLLMRACLGHGSSQELLELATRMNQEFRQLKPVTELDKLYGGSAITATNPEFAIQSLRDLADENSAPAVQYMLGRALFANILTTYDRSDLPEMLRLVDAAQAAQPGNLLAMRRRVLAHFLAADIYRLIGFKTDHNHHLYVANETARTMMATYRESAKSFQANALLAAFEGDWDSAIKYAREGQDLARHRDDSPDLVSFLHRAGQTAEALDYLSSDDSDHSLAGIYRCFLIAECYGVDEALAAYEHWLSGVAPATPVDRGVAVYGLFCYVGRPQEAVQRANEYRELVELAPAPSAMTATLDRFITGEITEHELIAAADTRLEKIHAHYFAGLHRLGHGDRPGAIAEFEAVATQGFPPWGLFVNDLSKGAAILLHRLQEDPSWPSWIPADDE